MNLNKIISLIVVLLLTFGTKSQVLLPKLVSNGMVLQQQTKVTIWGWASANEQINLSFLNKTYSCIANKQGNWSLMLDSLSAGGPYKMTIEGSNKIELSDIYVGEVWVCSGQSNMELTISRVNWVFPEVLNENNEQIRQFYVPRTYSFHGPLSDFESGSWSPATPENINNFSAVAYFFANKLFHNEHVPIGIINCALGGSPIQAWVSLENLKAFPDYYNEAIQFENDDYINQLTKDDNDRSVAWYKNLVDTDQGYHNGQNWLSNSFDFSSWDTLSVPGTWQNTTLDKINGSVWLKYEFDLTEKMASQGNLLILGRVIDADSAFINGKFVGNITYQYPPRRYNIPNGILQPGKNILTVKVIVNSGTGGFVPDKLYAITSFTDTFKLDGIWQYKIGTATKALQSQTFIRWKASGLYNAMLAPLTSFAVKGILWYQGEANTEHPNEYGSLLSTLIKNWRKDWQQPEMPFIYAQLPNFMEPQSEPTESKWASLRFNQLLGLENPYTAMTVNIDLGEWNDIHPVGKKEVANRMALAAEAIAYGKNLVYSGPIYKSSRIEGHKMIIEFSQCGSGLVCKNGNELKEFAVCGEDKHFVWAKAIIKDNHVVVWSDEVKNPIAVRYSWSNNPNQANLFNKEGLPASPFKTDTFEQ